MNFGRLQLGKLGALQKPSTSTPAPPSGDKILLADGSSKLLQTDGSSKILKAQ